MKKLIILVAATIILFLSACSASSKVEAVSTSPSTSTSSSTHCEVDSLCETLTKGVYIPTAAQKFMADDAYNTFITTQVKDPGLTEAQMKAAFKATYIGTYSNDPHYDFSVTIPSTKYANYYHVFGVDGK